MADLVPCANHAMLCLRAASGAAVCVALLIAVGVVWENPRGAEPGLGGAETATMLALIAALVGALSVVWVRSARRASGSGWGAEPWALTADLIAACSTVLAGVAGALAALMLLGIALYALVHL